ncbi:GNAT family N-acetyltransferase [Ancylomarina sp.]|uniref:GNAT family N-acetyltransferase n=1 Tax=Ancylomarina sp. TaxID=1970196 RepID=UPI00356864C9
MKNKLEIDAERLVLRRVCREDAEAIFKYRSDAVTNQYQAWIPKTIDDAQTFISKVAETIDEYDTWFQFGIINKDNGELVGDLGIHFFDTDKFQVEIGCTLAKSHRGKGLASEALKAIIKYLFEDLNKRRITCSIDPQNQASIKMVERLGFRKEAHFKQSVLIDGEWYDDVIYALLKDEWSK